jgi:hypothetical protein
MAGVGEQRERVAPQPGAGFEDDEADVQCDTQGKRTPEVARCVVVVPCGVVRVRQRNDAKAMPSCAAAPDAIR